MDTILYCIFEYFNQNGCDRIHSYQHLYNTCKHARAQRKQSGSLKNVVINDICSKRIIKKESLRSFNGKSNIVNYTDDIEYHNGTIGIQYLFHSNENKGGTWAVFVLYPTHRFAIVIYDSLKNGCISTTVKKHNA